MSQEIDLRVKDRWVLHDYLQVNGGAERLVMTAASRMPGFSLGISGIYPDFSGGALSGTLDVRVLSGAYRLLPRVPRALCTFSQFLPHIADASTVLYSGIYAPLAVHSQRNGRKVYYCHTPPRFAIDRKSEYLNRFPIGMRLLADICIKCYRRCYFKALGQMDLILVNSEHVRKRMAGLGIDTQVLYPPIDTARFACKSQGDYFLSLARLEPNKRVDQIIRAFIAMPTQKLVVASGGSQLATLRELAKHAPNIQFTNWVNDEKLANLIGNSRACIYIPRDEDFGMSAVEAMAAGKPVIGVADGGLLETIIDGTTGFLMSSQPEPTEIVQHVNNMTAPVALNMKNSCLKRAEVFSEKKFLEQLAGWMLKI